MLRMALVGPSPHRGAMRRPLVIACALGLAAVALAARVDRPAAEDGPGPWGVRTLPDGADGWRVRWQGAAAGTAADGQAGLRVAAGAVSIGATRMVLPPRPGPCAPLRFVVLGDGRAAVDGIGPSAYWPGILDEALALRPAFVVNTGDLVKNGDAPGEWPAYLRSLPPWPPIIAVRGNHDRGPAFYDLGLAPDTVFGHRLGPVYLVGLDTELRDGAFDAALARVERLFEGPEAQRATWRILALHRPVWSRGNHGSDERRVNDRLVPLIDRLGFDAVFAGHDHHYERFCPSLGHGADRRCAPPGQGVLYVVTGGAATYTNPVPGVSQKVDDAVAAVDEAHSRVFSGSKHVVEVEVDLQRLSLTARRTRTGNLRPAAVIDRFSAPARRRPPTACR